MEIRTSGVKKFSSFLESNWLTIIILLIFAAEASWLALTSRFPMAFDEGYHFNLIQFFSHRFNPIVTSQPSSTYALGAIVHNPSFLYHYLLSFPYRLIAHFTSSIETQVILLRFINIGRAITSLLIMKKILSRLGLPYILVNILLLVFALTPLVTALSAQINYDNLLILVASLSIYLCLRFVQQLRANVFELKTLLALICLCFYSSLVKYSFLPIFVGISLVVAWSLLAKWHHDRADFTKQLRSSYAKISKKTKLGLAIAGISGLSLFIVFYGVNTIKYHNPVPQCNQVLSISDCSQYYAWDRNYVVAQYDHTHVPTNKMNVLQYTYFWLKVEAYQLFAEIIPTGGLVYIAHSFYLIIIGLTIVVSICTLINIRKIFKEQKTFLALLVVAMSYLLFLWLDNYNDYLHLGQPLAIQGRDIVPVLIYIYALFGLGVMYSFKGERSARLVLRTSVASLAVFSFVYFGGYVRYGSSISPSDGWIHTQTIAKVSHIHSLSD